jgi:hypothetical protein
VAEILQNSEFVFWTAITLICTVPVIGHYWYKIRRLEIDSALKHAMIERGMSAEEIERVLRGSSRKKDKGGCEALHG